MFLISTLSPIPRFSKIASHDAAGYSTSSLPAQVSGESQHLLLLLGSGYPSFLQLKLPSLLLEILQLNQGIVPAMFQGAGHEAIRRIDFLISALGECGIILGTFLKNRAQPLSGQSR
jgi:hypothetical protein